MSQQENEQITHAIDEKIRSSKSLNLDVLKSFDEAYCYGAASTMNWLIARLKLTKTLINAGATIQIDSVGAVSDSQRFQNWVVERYPDISDEV